MPATELDFFTKSDKTTLGFALDELELLQPLTEGPSPELPPTVLRQSSLLKTGSEAEGTCNLMLSETLPPLSTGTTRINTKWKVPLSCFKYSAITAKTRVKRSRLRPTSHNHTEETLESRSIYTTCCLWIHLKLCSDSDDALVLYANKRLLQTLWYTAGFTTGLYLAVSWPFKQDMSIFY